MAHRWRDWADPRFVVCVFNNRDLAEVSWEQRETESEPRFPDSQEIPDFPYAGYAELLGLTGIRVDAPGQLGDAWDRALAADRPVVLEVLTDPDVPLLPPFPAGARKLDDMRSALAGEGSAGQRALELLDTYAGQEGRGGLRGGLRASGLSAAPGRPSNPAVVGSVPGVDGVAARGPGCACRRWWLRLPARPGC